jgi:hypothetical protein
MGSSIMGRQVGLFEIICIVFISVPGIVVYLQNRVFEP